MLNNKQNSGKSIQEILQDPKFAGKIIMKDMLPVKMSTVILDFAKPLLDKIDLSNESIIKKKVHMAIEIWNNIIVVDKACVKFENEGSRMYRMGLLGAARLKLPFRISHANFFKLVKRKDALFPDNNFFVIEHSLRWNDDGSEILLAVVTSDANKVDHS